MVKITIITICYNEEKSIKQTILSVLNQDYLNIEYIVIDGQSTDETINIIKQYQQKIDLFICEKDDGIYDAMNKGVINSHGEYLYFLNAGDRLYDQHVISQALQKGVNKEIIYGNLIESSPNTRSKIITQSRTINYMQFVFSTILHPASVVKKSLFLQYGLFDTKYKISADYDFFLRVAFKENVSTLYIPTSFVIFDSTGISSNPINNEVRWDERKRIQQQHLPIFYFILARIRHLFLKNQQFKVCTLLLSVSSLLYRKFYH